MCVCEWVRERERERGRPRPQLKKYKTCGLRCSCSELRFLVNDLVCLFPALDAAELCHTLWKKAHTHCLSHGFSGGGTSPGPSWRLRAQLLLTRWLSVSCLATKRHFFILLVRFVFLVLSSVLASPPPHHPVWPVCFFCLSFRPQLFLSFLLPFLVMCFF